MLNYTLASSTWDKKELDAIQSVINKDVYTMGDNVKQFVLGTFSTFLSHHVVTMGGGYYNR